MLLLEEISQFSFLAPTQRNMELRHNVFRGTPAEVTQYRDKHTGTDTITSIINAEKYIGRHLKERSL
jgi:hypothetical protein